MDNYTATEQAYKNGYEQGFKDAVKEGEWVECMVSAPDYYGLVFGWKCSVCGYNFEDRSKHRKKPIFMKHCPNCGARMKV